MQEQFLLVFREIGLHCPEEFAPQRLVEGTCSDGERKCLDHVLNKHQISHFLENRREFHVDLFRLYVVAQEFGDIIKVFLIDIVFLVVESDDQHLHAFSEILLVLVGEHANQCDL